MKNKNISIIIGSLLSVTLFHILHLFKISLIPGVSFALPAFIIAGPVSGSSVGSLIGFLLIIGQRFLFFELAGTAFVSTFYIPTAIGSLYWYSRTSIIRAFIPLICIALFILHPVGFQAAPYALFWLIPIIIYMMPFKNIFLTALGATFVQHAVGSVMWLYMVDMSSAQWLSLMPVVAVERLMSATIMVAAYYAISAATYLVLNLFFGAQKAKPVQA